MQSTALPQTNNGPAPYKRQLKNFLLMRSFQLKYTSYIVIISAILCAGLGVVVFLRTSEAYEQSQVAFDSAKEAQKAAQEAQKAAQEATRMLGLEKMLSDPAAAKEAMEKEDAKYTTALNELSQKAVEMHEKADQMASASKWAPFYLGALLGAMVIALGIFGIVMTHRIAGPLFVLSRMFQNISQGNFVLFKRSLRKGDEFPEIFQKGVDAIDYLAESAKNDLKNVKESMELLSTLKSQGADPRLISQIEEKLRAISAPKAKSIGQEA